MMLVSLAHAVTPPSPASVLNPPDRAVAVRLDAELGFLAPVAHTIQFGERGTTFDYVDDGGQEVLFPFARLQAGLDVGRESFLFLYQPLDLRTEVALASPLTVDTVTFAAGEAVDLRYGFSFWRATWLHELLPAPERELGVGLGLQLRDADIVFTSADGGTRFAERDVGPVPLLAARLRLPVAERGFLGAEAGGIWAPVKYLNGSDVDVEGALLDASLRGGLALAGGADVYVNARYLGGGAAGSSKNPEARGDGYTANWLHFATVSLGVGLR
ncbi:MAG: hypothetical protein ACOZNI_29570 [Myxococcota bacterium]